MGRRSAEPPDQVLFIIIIIITLYHQTDRINNYFFCSMKYLQGRSGILLLSFYALQISENVQGDFLSTVNVVARRDNIIY